MQIEPRVRAAHPPDASVLLRPRTGLQDMTIELDPGTEARAKIEEGSTIPLANSQPNVNPDQILASLDGDTRAYLQLLLAGAAPRGSAGNTSKLSSTLRRLEPLARDLAKINGLLAKRRENIAHVDHTTSAARARSSRPTTPTSPTSSTPSNQVFGAFAEPAGEPPARRCGSSRRRCGRPRGALASGDRSRASLEPALTRLIPQAKATGPALRAALRPLFHDTTSPIRDQIRPFTRKVQRPVRHLAQGSVPLAKTHQELYRGGFSEPQPPVNALAYNPPGCEEGYLFWIAWLNHDSNAALAAPGRHRRADARRRPPPARTAQLAESLTAARPHKSCSSTPSPARARSSARSTRATPAGSAHRPKGRERRWKPSPRQSARS